MSALRSNTATAEAPGPSRWRLWIALAAALLGAVRAFQRAWICDDAYISFRYARNLLDGHGLVFNPGEAVEGYTNFLWTLLCAAAMGLGLDAEAFTIGAGVAAYAATILLLARLGTGTLPLAALCWAAHGLAADFATSGLETSLFTLLTVATAAAAWRGSALAVGLLGTLATLTRPEGALVAALGVLAVALGPGGRRAAFKALLPGLVVAPVWLGWKLATYGALLPNTFYAKAGEGARWAEGLHYLWLYARAYTVVALGLPAAAWLAARAVGDQATRPLAIMACLLPILYLLHVAHVGGDFMFARFALPVSPLLLLALERAISWLQPRLQLGVGALCVSATALVVTATDLAAARGERPMVDGIMDERLWYGPERLAEVRRQAALLRPVLAGTGARVAFFGEQARLVTLAEAPYALEGEVGLTDAEVARLPSPRGARVGHGPKVDLDYLLAREIDLVLDWGAHVESTGQTRYNFLFDYDLLPDQARLGRIELAPGVGGFLLAWRRPVLDRLRANGARFADLEARLAAETASLDRLSDADLARAWRWYERHYFRYNPGSPWEPSWRARLAERSP